MNAAGTMRRARASMPGLLVLAALAAGLATVAVVR